MEPLFNRLDYPTLQDVFDRLYYYYIEGNRLLGFTISDIESERISALKEAKNLRKKIMQEYHELNLEANFQFYKKHKSSFYLYEKYKKTIINMAKFAGSLSYKNVNSYLYDIYSFANAGIISYKSMIIDESINTNGFF